MARSADATGLVLGAFTLSLAVHAGTLGLLVYADPVASVADRSVSTHLVLPPLDPVAPPPAPEPVAEPEPEPEPEMIRPGIDASSAQTPNWLGFADETEHAAPLGNVEQSPLAPVPGERTDAPTPAPPAGEVPTTEPEPAPPRTSPPRAAERTRPSPAAPERPESEAPREPRPTLPDVPAPPPADRANERTTDRATAPPVETIARPAAGATTQPQAAAPEGARDSAPPAGPAPETRPATEPVVKPLDADVAAPGPEHRVEAAQERVNPADEAPAALQPGAAPQAKPEPKPEPKPEKGPDKGPEPETVGESGVEAEHGPREALPITEPPSVRESPTEQEASEASLARAELSPAEEIERMGPPRPAREGPPTPEVRQGAPGFAADAEADAVAIREAIDVRMTPGRVLAAAGLRITTVRPQWSIVTRAMALPRNPVVRVVFGRGGNVLFAEFVNGQNTGDAAVDGPLLDAIYRWRAQGERLAALSPTDPRAGLTMSFRIILRSIDRTTDSY